MTINREQLLLELEQAMNSNELAVFAGAGLSVSSGYFNWRGLLEKPAKNIGLDVSKEHNLVEVAQYIENKNNRGYLNNIICQAFPSNIPPSQNHELISKLPIDTVWTTNYDKLFEKAYNNINKNVSIKTEDSDLQVSSKNYDVVIYKMHGDIDSPNRTVFTRNDYEKYGWKDRILFRNVLEGHLLTKTFLFLGFSFTDPNFQNIMSKIRILLDGATRTHYCILKEEISEEYTDPSEFIYAKAKQDLLIDDLKRNGITVHLIKDYCEITDILNALYSRYRNNTIFISGSVDDYNPMDEPTGIEFIKTLSRELVNNGYSVVNGYGKGVGEYVVRGVTEYCYMQKNKSISDYLTLFPFPLNAKNDVHLHEIWLKYREEMISRCGIAIFIFGNKTHDGRLISADGVQEEFQIAKENNLELLPISYTGNTAQNLVQEVADKRYLNMINDEFKTVQESVEEIIKIVNKIKSREVE